jgi:hypothetical protein
LFPIFPATCPVWPIVVKFLRLKNRAVVLEKANNLRGTYIFLNKDYLEAVRQKRKKLIPAMKADRAHGDIAYIRYDRLIVHPPSLKSGRDESQAYVSFLFLCLLFSILCISLSYPGEG